MTCLCDSIPSARKGEVWSRANKLVHTFHLDCPDHGITLSVIRPMREVWKRGWLTPEQAIHVARNTIGRLIEKAKDGKTALCEWLTYEFQPTAEEGDGGEVTNSEPGQTVVGRTLDAG